MRIVVHLYRLVINKSHSLKKKEVQFIATCLWSGICHIYSFWGAGQIYVGGVSSIYQTYEFSTFDNACIKLYSLSMMP